MAEETLDAAVKALGLSAGPCKTVGLMLEGAKGWTPTLYIRLVQDYGLENEVRTSTRFMIYSATHRRTRTHKFNPGSHLQEGHVGHNHLAKSDHCCHCDINWERRNMATVVFFRKVSSDISTGCTVGPGQEVVIAVSLQTIVMLLSCLQQLIS